MYFNNEIGQLNKILVALISHELLFQVNMYIGVSPNFKITVACDLKLHRYFRVLSLKFQKATKYEQN